jgi:hypothetical protein
VDWYLKLISLVFTGLGLFAATYAPVFHDYTAFLAATAAGCAGVSGLCQTTLSAKAVPAPAPAPAPAVHAIPPNL